MSLRSERIFWVICESCGAEHHKIEARSALEARVAAGAHGWGYRSEKPKAAKSSSRHALDWCPNCTEEMAVKAREAQEQA